MMVMRYSEILKAAGTERPVLIAGPTASGKSALALALAEASGGRIVNADALQVFADWRILTARPSVADEARVPHLLYGHVPGDAAYSVGHWLRAVAGLIEGARPIIVGGTGLYFAALTEGLAEVPPVPHEIRAQGDTLLAQAGLAAMVAQLDAPTRARIDLANPRRVQRAWEVLQATGQGLCDWQRAGAAPLLPRHGTLPLLLAPPREVLNARIEARVDAMLAGGLLDEGRANLDAFSPGHPSAKAIGAQEVIAHLRGTLDQEALRAAMVIRTRQYAKRQRSWFRGRMSDWQRVDPA